MSSGKYQVRRSPSKKVQFTVYCILDNQVVCRFDTEKQAIEYAKMLNGELDAR